MHDLQELDRLLADVAALVYRTVPMHDWQQAILHANYTPDGSVSGHDFDYLLADGRLDRSSGPWTEMLRQISDATERHWAASEPRWYAMHLVVSRDGKISTNWEYEDNYQEGDIMRRAR
jgi:hypothetical protein